jgi:D-arabinose 1-dehydrogenase-like Zn-dependent alcohol dehydrogenase
MASHTVFHESFTYRLPPAISKEAASALMCAGATVFNILDMFNIKPTERVGIVGIGGLGHLAVQFAAKWGCEVVVFSATEDKREHATQLGATEFRVTGVEKLEGIAPIDHLMVTTSQQIPWPLYMSLMASQGTIYPLTFSADDLKIPYQPLLSNGLRIQGSIVAPRVIYKRMLKFAEFHGIGPSLQRYRLDEAGIEKAMADLREGKMRYRGVLCASE